MSRHFAIILVIYLIMQSTYLKRTFRVNIIHFTTFLISIKYLFSVGRRTFLRFQMLTKYSLSQSILTDIHALIACLALYESLQIRSICKFTDVKSIETHPYVWACRAVCCLSMTVIHFIADFRWLNVAELIFVCVICFGEL